MAKKSIYDFSTNKTVTRDLTSEEQKELDAQKPSAEKKLEYLRLERNRLLFETDWWASSDLTMTDAQKKYRQDLRDITKTYQSLSDKDFAFPTKPTE
tara:strand:- start:446 stop:736 length:291 start_codon:yes stop_codon:yes gene_type:complete